MEHKITLIWVLGVLEIMLNQGTAQAVTLKDSFRAALARSEVVATQHELLVQQEEIYRQTKGNLLPSVSAVASDFWQQTPPGGSIPGSPAVQPGVRLVAQQSLFRGFREFAALRQTRDLVQAQDQAWMAAAIQLYKDVATSFYSVVASERDLSDVREEIGLYRKRVQDLQYRVRIGRSRLSEVLTVQSAQAALVAQAEQLKGQIAVERTLFSFLTGFGGDVIVHDVEETPSGPLDLNRYLTAVGLRPDVKSAERSAESASEGIAIAKGAHLPSADLFGNYYLYRTGSLGPINWDVQVVLTLPLFEGGILASKVRQSESQKDQADLAVSQTRRQAEREVRQDFDQFDSDRRQLRTLADALNLARRNYEAETREYRLGLVTNLDVLSAMTSYEEAQRSLDRTRAAVKLDYAALEASVARRPAPDEMPRNN